MSFDICLDVILPFEGGISNDPDDPGGLTNKGVTQSSYDEYCTKLGLPHRPVTSLSDVDIRKHYRDVYWVTINGDQLPYAPALVLFDCAINQGVGYARKLLQWSVGVKQDGDLGSITMAAVAKQDPEELAQLLIWGRTMRYVATCRFWEQKKKPNPWKYIYGWLMRLDKVRLACKLGTSLP